MRKIFIPSLLVSFCLFAVNSANASTACYGASCTGKQVEDYPCPVSFYKSKNIYARYGQEGTRVKIGKLTFYYSSACKANWAKVRDVEDSFLNEDIWVTVEKEDGSMQSSHKYENGVAVTPMIDGRGKVKATGWIDSGGAYTYRASLEY